MLELSNLDLDEIASALADQGGFERRWLIHPETGVVGFWTAETASTARRPLISTSWA